MKKLIIAAALLAIASFANAETVTWSYPAGNDIDGFVLYENVNGSAVEVARLADPMARTWTLDLGDFIGCRGFFMAAYAGTQTGNYGDLYVKCPEQSVPEFRVIPMDRVEGILIRD